MNPLVGREQVMSSLGGHLDATLRGSSSCVVIEGPFGVGKTHLLKATALEAAERGLTVVAGRANGTDRPILIHLLINFLRHVVPGEADFDDLARPESNPFWLTDRVGELVESATRRHPLVVVLDDAQRIDEVSALALREMVRSLDSSPVLWLLARRPVAAPSLAQCAVDWLIDHAAVRLRLGGLDDRAVAELCTGILGARPDRSVLGWAARCGGNPWLMENVFSALLKAGQMMIVDGAASVTTERLPEGVLAALRGLLDQMPPGVRRLLLDVARIGHSFTVDEAAARLGGSALDLPAGVDEAVRLGLLRRDGRELAFTHQLVGEALQHAAFRSPEPTPTPTRATIVPRPGTVPAASAPRRAIVTAAVPTIGVATNGGDPPARHDGASAPARGAHPAEDDRADVRPEPPGPVPPVVSPSRQAAELRRLAGHPLTLGDVPEEAARREEDAPRSLRPVDAHTVRRLGAERPKSGWESLTSAELRVVRAIVDGRTNREAASVLFLSPHTVDSHLRRVFSKLDISSRVELTRHFIAHEAPPPAMAGAHRPGSTG